MGDPQVPEFWKPRVRAALRGGGPPAEPVVDEIAFHLAGVYRDALTAGAPPDEAMAAAEAELEEAASDDVFGRVRAAPSRVEPTVAGAAWWFGWWQDVRYGARLLWRQRGFTVLAILTLALGIGGSTAVFSLVDATLFRPLMFADGERLVRVRQSIQQPGGAEARVSLSARQAIRVMELPAVQAAVAQRFRSVALRTDDGAQRVASVRVSSGWIETLGVPPVLGRVFTARELQQGLGAGAVVIGHGIWQRHFTASPQALGTTLFVDEEPYTVVGVMPPGFNFPYDAQVWFPLPLDPADGAGDLNLTALLAPGEDRSSLRAQLATLAAEMASEEGGSARRGFHVVTTREDLIEGSERLMNALLAAIGILLLVACSNIATMMLARGSARRRDSAVRAALGASRARQIRHVLTESVLLSAVGGLCGGVLSLWLGSLIASMVPEDIQQVSGRVVLDYRALAFTCIVTAVCGIVFGLAPALRQGAADPADALKEESRGASGRTSLLSSFVVVQIALSFALLVGASVTARAVHRELRAPVGFDPENLWTAYVALSAERYPDPWRRADVFLQIAGRVSELPGVEATALVNLPPLVTANTVASVQGDGADAGGPYQVNNRLVSEGYFETLGATLLRGRAFDTREGRDGQPAAIVSASLADRLWPDGNAVGRQLRRFTADPDEPSRTVIGVVENVEEGRELDDTLYLPYRQAADALGSTWAAAQSTLLVRAPVRPEGFAESVRRAVAEVDPSAPVYDMATMSERQAQRLAPQRSGALLLGLFGAAGIAMGAVGIYGLLAFFVAIRTREIGIRLALGATAASVTRALLSRVALLVAAGLAGGALVALVLGSFMTLIPGIGRIELLPLFTVAVAVAAVAFAAAYVPLRRATRVDPLTALRAE